MGWTTVWPRLIWKEFRESILVAVLCILLPVAGFKIGTWVPEWVAATLTPFAVFIWAAAKANTRRQRREFEATHLPLPAAEEWLASFLFPAIIAALIGASYGYWGSSLVHLNKAGLLTLAGTLYILSGFGVCYVVSTAFSIVPAMLVAVGWVAPALPLMDAFEGRWRTTPQRWARCSPSSGGESLAEPWARSCSQRPFSRGRSGLNRHLRFSWRWGSPWPHSPRISFLQRIPAINILGR